MENFAPYSLDGDTDGAFVPADMRVGTHTVTVTPYPRPNLNGTPGPSTTITFQVVDNPTTTPTLITEENSDHAVAINAATWVREPFSLFTNQPFSSDKRTRVSLFITDFDSLNSDTMSEAVVQVENSVIGTVSLPIEHVGKLSSFDWITQIDVVLPDSVQNAGDVWVKVSFRGASTNPARMRIKQASVGANEPSWMKLLRDPWIIPDLRFLWPIV